jgi:hypothetical protein
LTNETVSCPGRGEQTLEGTERQDGRAGTSQFAFVENVEVGRLAVEEATKEATEQLRRAP